MNLNMAALLSSSVTDAAASEGVSSADGQLPVLNSFIMASSTSTNGLLAVARPPAIEILSGDDDDEEEFDEENPQWAKWNCQQIRTKIRNFLGTKEMMQTAFLKLCDINSNSYYRFMNLKGPFGGCDNQTRRKSKTGDDLLQKIQDVDLPDAHEDGTVPVYDDCDEVRKKINYFLGEKTVTKAAFLRALGDVNSNSLRSFMNMKRGAGSGAANVVYRTVYVFFEKKRILEGGKKTKKRLDNEAKQGRNGFPLRHDNGMRWVIVGKGM
ncbi:hypothetical protein PF007_g8416 [Phytophthora fragariae]|uniref:DUF7726 domain-containing protein n=1 Tax=Phytophthora fragariae TaxID=53985 RepID=A0A6A3FPP7_9STRA|nr:hypothetical protein PF009_g6597 [Phytophthora fragariae]KAE9119786.1 hypothetical protein PF007_g8416 [Phytophthora fragariae]